jgi:hypothetical protein
MSHKLKAAIALLAAVGFSSTLALADTYHVRIPLRTLAVTPATSTGTPTGPGDTAGSGTPAGPNGSVGTGGTGSDTVGELGSGPAVEAPPPPPPVEPISTGYTTAGTYYVTVPAGYTSMSVKMWGAGGGGTRYTSGGTATITSGTGGGGGFTSGTLAVTPGMTFQVVVGSSGAQSTAPFYGGPGRGNGSYKGGGYSGIFFNTISQANAAFIAGGGGGGGIVSSGGVCRGSSSNLIAGGGGGAVGTAGKSSGGGGGSQSAGGSGRYPGTALQGGNSYSTHADCGDAGGGGGGYFGGGSGTASSSNTSGGSGGGGSGFATASATNVVMLAAGQSSAPANSADPSRANAGQGAGSDKGATPGNVVITFN